MFGYLVNKPEIWWVYLSPIENSRKYINPSPTLNKNILTPPPPPH